MNASLVASAWVSNGGLTIDWTSAEAFTRAVMIAERILPVTQATGFAACRYHEATGRWPDEGLRYDTSPLGTGKNWVTSVGGLPSFVRAIAHALIRNGHTESEAIQIAVGVVYNWASGKGNVTPKTRAKAAATVAEWEAKKAAAHATRAFDVNEPRDPLTGKWIGHVILAQDITVGDRLDPGGRSRVHAVHFRGDHVLVAYKTHGAKAPGLQHRRVGSTVRVYRRAPTRDGFVTETSADGAGSLLPKAPVPHLPTRGGTRGRCGKCGKRVTAKVHTDALGKSRRAGKRDAGRVYRYRHGWVPLVGDVHSIHTKRSDGREVRLDRQEVIGVGKTHVNVVSISTKRRQRISHEAVDLGFRQGTRRVMSGGNSGMRHAGPDGHHHVVTGHYSGARRRVSKTVDAHATALEPAAEAAVKSLFAAQRRATIDRLGGNRGKAMVRDALVALAADTISPRVRLHIEQCRAASDEPPNDNGPAPLVDAGQVFDIAHWIPKTQEALQPTYAAAAGLTQTRLAKLGSTPTSQQAVTDALAARSGNLAQTMNTTTLQAVQAALAQGVIEGQSIAEMTKAVNAVFDHADAVRAQLIARTEVIGAMNTAADAQATALGPDVVAGKEWVATHDDRTRPTHRAADGQIAAMGIPFTVGGFPMQHPGDPTAPPSEVCNCRCTTGFLTPAEYAKRTGITIPSTQSIAA